MLFQLPGDCEVCRLVAKCSDFLVVFTYFCFDASGVRGTAGMVSGLDFVEAASWLSSGRPWETVPGFRGRGRCAVAGGDPVGAR